MVWCGGKGGGGEGEFWRIINWSNSSFPRLLLWSIYYVLFVKPKPYN